MRLSRLLAAALPTAALLAACQKSDSVTTETRPPLAGVRYVHAVNDTSRLDFRMVDQLSYSANTVDSIGGLRYRQASRYFPTEAKARHIRVFNYYDVPTSPTPNTRDPSIVSQIMVDTNITFEANKNYTLLLVGSARAAAGSAGGMRFVLIDDTPPAVDTSVVHVRAINANTGARIDAYTVATATTAPAGTPPIAGVADRAASSYTAFPKGTLAVRVADAGSVASLTTVAADTGVAGTTSINPVAGSRRGGTAFSAYVFAPGVTGSGVFLQPTILGTTVVTQFQSRGVTLLVDRLPPNTVAAP